LVISSVQLYQASVNYDLWIKTSHLAVLFNNGRQHATIALNPAAGVYTRDTRYNQSLVCDVNHDMVMPVGRSNVLII
jgi:hypothetical protein